MYLFFKLSLYTFFNFDKSVLYSLYFFMYASEIEELPCKISSNINQLYIFLRASYTSSFFWSSFLISSSFNISLLNEILEFSISILKILFTSNLYPKIAHAIPFTIVFSSFPKSNNFIILYFLFDFVRVLSFKISLKFSVFELKSILNSSSI